MSGQMFLCGAFVTHYAEWNSDRSRVLTINTDRRRPRPERVQMDVGMAKPTPTQTREGSGDARP